MIHKKQNPIFYFFFPFHLVDTYISLGYSIYYAIHLVEKKG